MKFFRWFQENILFVLTLFLLAFIPLYPKLPLLDIKNTWVYVRVEDFLVVFAAFLWFILLVRKKISLKTPLTIPILVFWIVGAIATIHGVLLIFPTIADVFPNVAFLSFLRHIEYLSLFFIAYAGMRDKRFLSFAIIILVATLLLVSFYGIGQKYLGFPAFLTMNEEFAKGEPIRLSELSRVPSTFAGHYDLAAYLVLILPLLASMIFGFRNIVIRLLFAASVALGFLIMFMTVSRVSFVVLLVSLGLVLLFQKKKMAIASLLVLGVLATILTLTFMPALMNRFGDTVKEVDVLVDAKTGEVIGHTQIVPKTQFADKLVIQRAFQRADAVSSQAKLREEDLLQPASSFYRYKDIPQRAVLLVPPNTSTGENLPQGTGYINLTLSPVIKRLGVFFYEDPPEKQASSSALAFVFQGNFLIKRASAYDLSFTTRFQGEWPNAIKAFTRNVLFGSGYSSVGLSVDNNYLRILGETGLVGFVSFLAIFITVGIYIQKLLPEVDSKVARSFILGFVAGVIGLMLNGLLIDVFEASKVAFVLWLLTGITLGALHLYQTKQIHLHKELLRIAASNIAIVIYLLVITILVFLPLMSYYFVGDDYTWLRWAADCRFSIDDPRDCSSPLLRAVNYFTDSNGFFYRPGTKLYFFLLYPVIWLNQNVYHLVSIFLHFSVAVLFFLLAKKLLRNTLLATAVSVLFLFMSGYSEIVFWIAATGHLFNAVFILLSLLFFIKWEEKKNNLYLFASLLSMFTSLLFHELGIVAPLLAMLYVFVKDDTFHLKRLLKPNYLILFSPIVLYLFMRFIAGSHWSGGDYSYNLLKLPFNAIGNSVGYVLLTFFGPISLPFYQLIREGMRENLLVAFVVSVIAVSGVFFIFKKVLRRIVIDQRGKKILIFGVGFFIIALLPFLGFGNITSRYSYLASFGLLLLLVIGLQKLYYLLLRNGRDIAIAGLTFVIAVFALLHIIQVQQIHGDWHEAGEKAKRFFTSIDGLYTDYWSDEPVGLHFYNVPIRSGGAWVFPVGLPDAIWFAFRNPTLRVYIYQSEKEAFDAAGIDARNEKILEFDESGNLIEKGRERNKASVQ